jgi:hypothetical protein
MLGGAIAIVVEAITRAFGGVTYPVPHLFDGKRESAILPRSLATGYGIRHQGADGHRPEKHFDGLRRV